MGSLTMLMTIEQEGAENVSAAKIGCQKWGFSDCSKGRLIHRISLEGKDHGKTILSDDIWECEFEGNE